MNVLADSLSADLARGPLLDARDVDALRVPGRTTPSAAAPTRSSSPARRSAPASRPWQKRMPALPVLKPNEAMIEEADVGIRRSDRPASPASRRRVRRCRREFPRGPARRPRAGRRRARGARCRRRRGGTTTERCAAAQSARARVAARVHGAGAVQPRARRALAPRVARSTGADHRRQRDRRPAPPPRRLRRIEPFLRDESVALGVEARGRQPVNWAPTQRSPDHMDYPGNLYAVAAPSGAGSLSLVKALLELDSHLSLSISHTRKPRGQDQHGREYHFVDEPTFRAMIERGEFVEWAEVHGNLYGTSRGRSRSGSPAARTCCSRSTGRARCRSSGCSRTPC